MALHDAGFTIAEIVARRFASVAPEGARARREGGCAVATAHSAVLDATLLWFCVPDREIHDAAAALAARDAASREEEQGSFRFSLQRSAAQQRTGSSAARQVSRLHLCIR